MDELLTIKNMDGIPFSVVYSASGVSFHDRRYHQHMPYGQFVTGYDVETLLKRKPGYALPLNGDWPQWTIDATTMYVVMTWLNHMVWQEES
jgi:hypothetical protein